MTGPQPRRCTNRAIGVMIGRYEHGRLDETERRSFEAHLLECDYCFAELERGDAAASAMRDHAGELREALRRDRWRAWWPARRRTALVPIGVAVLLAAFIAHDALRSPDSARWASYPATLSDIIDLDDPGQVREPGTADPLDELLAAGRGHYDAGADAEAVRFLRAARRRVPEDLRAATLLGLALARSGDAAAALPHLRFATSTADSAWGDLARWGAANCHLALDQSAEAESLLIEIRNRGGRFAPEADQLLERLP